MSKSQWWRVSACVLLVGLGACDVAKSLNPCSRDGACEVDGVDLIVDRLTVSAPTIAEINMPAIASGSTFDVAFLVRNRGSDPSPATTISLCAGEGYCVTAPKPVQLRALEPGETQGGTVSIVLSPEIAGDGGVYAEVQHSDVDNSNSDVYTRVLFERPNLTASLQVLSGEWQVGTSLRAELRVRNQAYVAGAAAANTRVCLRNYGQVCLSGLGSQNVGMPLLAAGAVRVDTVSFPLILSALQYPDRAESHALLACADINETVQERNENDGCAESSFTALPNLDLACGPATISVGQSVSGTVAASDCDFSFGSNGDLFRFTGAANTRYTFHLVSYPAVQDAHLWLLTDRGARLASTFYLNHGEGFTFTTGVAGTYYVALSNSYSGTGHAYTVRLSQP